MRAAALALGCGAALLQVSFTVGIEDGLALVQQQTRRHGDNSVEPPPKENDAIPENYGFPTVRPGDEPWHPEEVIIETPKIEDFLQTVVSEALTDGISDVASKLNVTEFNAKRSPDTTRRAMLWNLKVKEVGQATKKKAFRTFSDRCNPTDGEGSMDCFIPFGEILKPDASDGYYFTATPGSTMRVRTTLDVGNPGSTRVNDDMPQLDYVVPLCGKKKTIRVDASPTTVGTWMCGENSLNLEFVADWAIKGANKIFDGALVQNAMDPLLPLKVYIDMDLANADGSKIVSFSLVTGVAKL